MSKQSIVNIADVQRLRLEVIENLAALQQHWRAWAYGSSTVDRSASVKLLARFTPGAWDTLWEKDPQFAQEATTRLAETLPFLYAMGMAIRQLDALGERGPNDREVALKEYLPASCLDNSGAIPSRRSLLADSWAGPAIEYQLTREP